MAMELIFGILIGIVICLAILAVVGLFSTADRDDHPDDWPKDPDDPSNHDFFQEKAKTDKNAM